MWCGAQHNQIDKTSGRFLPQRPAARHVAARAECEWIRPRHPVSLFHPFASEATPRALANARGRVVPPARPRAPLYRDFDQAHRHGPARIGARQELLGLPLVLLRCEQIPQRSLHVVHRRPPAQARRLGGGHMPRTGFARHPNREA